MSLAAAVHGGCKFINVQSTPVAAARAHACACALHCTQCARASCALTSCPLLRSLSDWHQATVYFACTNEPEDAWMKRWVPFMFLMSALMVLAQVCTCLHVGVCVRARA